MKFIYILEDDERIQKELYETLKGLDSRLVIRFFPSLEHFHNWLRTAIQYGPKALSLGGAALQSDNAPNPKPSDSDELRLVIAKNEFLGIRNMALIKRAQEFFLRKKICPAHEPTSLILTAFDNPDFDIKLAEERIINNVLYKPFDKLILKQHLEYALKGHHPIDSQTISAIHITSMIEMLKEVPFESLSEVGFSTKNNHEIKIGAMGKYYSPLFSNGEKRSALAYCKSCQEITPNEFHGEFYFFGLDNIQIGQLRRYILQQKNHTKTDVKNEHGRNLNLLILDADENVSKDLVSFLNEKFSSLKIFTYTLNAQLLSDLADRDTIHKQQLPNKIDLVIANLNFLDIDPKKTWENICQKLQERTNRIGFTSFATPDLYLTSKEKVSIENMKKLASLSKDIFFLPIDKSYMYKKILLQTSSATTKEATTLASLSEKSTLKVANPTEITEISEAGLVMKYYRTISTGSFREFILLRQNEQESPEIIGTVNFSEANKNGNNHEESNAGFLNHFVFFGMKDFYLKHIRLWLREAYIKSKES